jgi:molecular chaperone DnaK
MTIIPFRQKAAGKGNNGENPVGASPPRGAPAVGIDLGTTNSVVSVYAPGQEHPRSLEFDGAPLVPSMIHVSSEAGFSGSSPSDAGASKPRVVVGRAARDRLADAASEVVRSTKRDMGRPGRAFTSNGSTFSAEDAAREVLTHLASHPELAEVRAAQGGLWSVITVPAHFDDAARQATIASARQAGLEVLRIINEPTAAALAYSMLPDVRHADAELLAVFDLGGGTFDVSVVEREGLVFNVLSSEGDVQLGGDDFDAELARHLLARVEPVLTARRAGEDSELFRNLLVHAERAKKALQESGEHHVLAEDLDGHGASVDIVITRDVFEGLVAPLVQRTLELTERAIHAARKRPQHISRILLVGGSTRVALVQRMLQGYFPSCLVDARLEPDLAVSWGAAVQAAIILGIEPDTILVDVCSHTLGIGVAEDSRAVNENFKEVCRRFGLPHPIEDARLAQLLGSRVNEFNAALQGLLRVAPIIHRNSPLPSRKSEFFSTLYHNQAAVQVVVVQGDEDTVSSNRLIGSFLFDLQQPCPAGTRCEIQLTYDVNGMVHVLAKQLGTDNAAEAEFDSRTGEVKGWVSLEEPLQSPTAASSQDDSSATPNAGGVESVDPHGQGNVATLTGSPREDGGRVIALAFGARRSSDPASEGANTSQDDDRDILNGLLLRVRRTLAALDGDDVRRAQLAGLAQHYAELLRSARSGEDVDADLEVAETRILDLLEAFDA